MKSLTIPAALVLALALFIPVTLAEYTATGKTTDNLRLRKEPSLSAQILATASKGVSVNVTQQDPVVNDDGTWYPVLYNGTAGYMSAEYLSIQQESVSPGEIGYINDNRVNFRTQPNTNCDKILVFSRDAKVEVTGITNGWYSIRYNDKDGYVRSDFVSLASDGYTPSSSPARSTLDSADISEIRREIVEYSFNYLGKPYKYAAAGPNAFDCSGFTTYIFKKYGYGLNRSSRDQYKNGTAVSKADLLPGDLVFFRTTSSKNITHVGMYIGGGQFIHSSSGKKSVIISEINTGYYNERYVGAKRVL